MAILIWPMCQHKRAWWCGHKHTLVLLANSLAVEWSEPVEFASFEFGWFSCATREVVCCPTGREWLLFCPLHPRHRWSLQATNNKLQTTNYRLQVTYNKLKGSVRRNTFRWIINMIMRLHQSAPLISPWNVYSLHTHPITYYMYCCDTITAG